MLPIVILLGHHISLSMVATIMTSERIWLLIGVTGFFLSILGVFLPWGQPGAYAYAYGFLRTLLGLELVVGTFALVGSVVNGASLFFFRLGHKMVWCAVMLLGGLITLVSSLTWILIPGILAPVGYTTYTVLFGTYICFTGSVLTSTAAILYPLYH